MRCDVEVSDMSPRRVLANFLPPAVITTMSNPKFLFSKICS